ncbi:hypothetical protein CJI59_34610 [Streptomyces sp. Alain-F2R5]|uniref:DUF1707 SHOCT-like domain-containing protein n=1 Tax=Streptomyces TaxID=1883 RepID=UPI000A2640CB|nr:MULTISPECIES: DUF1707 domain-containing protein [unclassified Streptomyces]MDG9690429.1 DUF1707 domain-containing protein [Streptomyces sp. DH17]OSC73412.1 hypothetical protein B5181_00440 [Streptomyces sp. 4F]MDN3246351.1 DUF1707 domain-containing protein [Streptomyces sp. ZSW22]MDN3251213.1 DUF1707 domain-containing protein [Streptomyces sp. MA25(2023)]MDQ0387557.1 hypothetical protein [Streptomyces sp. DSM 42143]
MTDDAPELRASDADRERVAEVLREALAEGRLDMAEFEERLDATYSARTYGELAPITRDLPVGTVAAPKVSMTKEPAAGEWAGRITGGEGSSSWAVAVMSGFERKGRWTVPRRFNSLAFWGGGDIDLREANFADGEVVINCVAIMGGIDVIVPPGVEVIVRGVGVMGDFDHRESGVPGDPGAPRVIVTGFAFWGGVGVRRKLTRAEKLRIREERRQEKLERKAARRELRSSLGDSRDDLTEAHRRMLDGHRDMLREHRDERREQRELRREERDRRRRGED